MSKETRKLIGEIVRFKGPRLVLHVIAKNLNSLAEYRHRSAQAPRLQTEKAPRLRAALVGLTWNEAWHEAEKILLSPDAVNPFNVFAENVRFVLRAEKHRTGQRHVPVMIPLMGQDYRGQVVALLWHALFRTQEGDRLKRCSQCQTKWFVDQSRNKSRMWCSEKCKWRWWDRKRRKKARHSQYSYLNF